MLYRVARVWMKSGVKGTYGVFDQENILQISKTWSVGSWKMGSHRSSLLSKFGRYRLKETRLAFIKLAATRMN